jgi:hypothetical protein
MDAHERATRRTDAFSHPDFTVGSGLSPDQPLARLAGFTAGQELHLAPKARHQPVIPLSQLP